MVVSELDCSVCILVRRHSKQYCQEWTFAIKSARKTLSEVEGKDPGKLGSDS